MQRWEIAWYIEHDRTYMIRRFKIYIPGDFAMVNDVPYFNQRLVPACVTDKER